MQATLSMALVLGVCGLAGMADDKVVDPVGTWKCEYEIGGQQRTSTLKVKKDGDNLAGTMSWPDQDETKLKDLKLKDGTLTFSAVRKLAGMDDGFTVEYKLKVEGISSRARARRNSEERSGNGISRARGRRTIRRGDPIRPLDARPLQHHPDGCFRHVQDLADRDIGVPLGQSGQHLRCGSERLAHHRASTPAEVSFRRVSPPPPATQQVDIRPHLG